MDVSKLKVLKIRVTEKDIRDGVVMSPIACPIAISLNRMGGWNSYVDRCNAKAFGHTWKLSRSAMKFIKSFDKNKPVEPSIFIFRKVS